MIQIGPGKLVFIKDIIGVFSFECIGDIGVLEYEYVSSAPYKSIVVARTGKHNELKAYYTSLSLRSLRSRIQKQTER